MPAPVTSHSSARTVNKGATLKPRSQVQAKKTRIVRPRGRAKDAGSDDEIEREVGTDSESEDDFSSLGSDSDSDTEPASEDVIPNGHSRTFTPSTSQSPGDRGPLIKDSATTDATSFFTPTGNWSEMVADETANGPADLPVIEFADFDGQHVPQAGLRPRKAKKSTKSTHPTIETQASPVSPHLPLREDVGNEVAEEADPVASSSRRSTSPSYRRPAGQTARQAYQQRLESDPSYVPTVGGFWGHDDRLLDKDLRSLSGWWRGRWQGRGRGRGYIRGRGRGGFFPPNSQSTPHTDVQDGDNASSEPVDLPPIERAWTHDGFEEMKRKEEQRRLTQQPPAQSQSPQSTRGTGVFRGGRGYAPGRGGRGGFSRGGYLGSPTSLRNGASFGNQKRTWFAMKPELMWTKQHEAFLHFDSAMKPRPGYGPSYRVKVPGSQEQIIRAPPRQHHSKVSAAKHSTASVLGSDLGDDRTYAVRLPQRSRKAKQAAYESAEETLMEEVFTVRPKVAERNAIPLPMPITDAALPPTSSQEPIFQPDPPIATSSQSQPDASTRYQLERLSLEPQASDPARWAQTEEAVLKNPPTEVTVTEDTQRPELPNLQTMFTPPPVSQPSPAYGSPYGYAPALPPGIAMNQHGMAYELATGRPVYLQPPPPPMYNPRPIMHSHMSPPGLPYVPGHMHHHSAISPDFLAHSASHTPPMNGFIDPSTGTPIFSFPRQTSRIEIRAPSEDAEVKSPGKAPARRVSGLRTAAVAFEPLRAPESHVNGYFPSMAASTDMNSLPSYGSVDGAEGNTSGDDGHGNQQHVADPAMMAYPQYQQQYYYPEVYTYPPYVDMSQGQYEMYPPDPLVPQGTVYY